MKDYFYTTFAQLKNRKVKMDVITGKEVEEFRKVVKKYNHTYDYLRIFFGIRGHLVSKIMNQKAEEIKVTISMAKRVYDYLNFDFENEIPEEFDFSKLNKRVKKREEKEPGSDTWKKSIAELLKEDNKKINLNKPKQLKLNKKYKIVVDNQTLIGTVVTEYKHHYGIKDENEHRSTILKNDLSMKKTKVIALN